jgi:O-antigen biosynthesis protein
MILAALLVRRRGARLRVITRTEPAHTANLHNILTLYGMAIDDEVEFAFAHVNAPQAAVNIFPDELFITTSWWTTESALAAIAPARILYVLQEDERLFYPAGDDQLRCLRTLANEQMHVVVNTAGLLEHLVASGLPHLARTARPFEPAFPAAVYRRRPRLEGQRRRLMFYARPNHLRNLFYFGLEVIDQAIAQGVIDMRTWEIHFVGAHIPPVTLCDGSAPICHEQLSWPDYAELAGGMDVALSLMFTPHPSYPPLDLAASGAVVVSNRHGNKQDLAPYCANILLADLNIPSMLATLREALHLAVDEPERQRHFDARGMQTDWNQALAPVLQHFGNKPDVWA